MPSSNPCDDVDGLVAILDEQCWIGAGCFESEWSGPPMGYVLLFPSADHVVDWLRDSVFAWDDPSEADPDEAARAAEIRAWIRSSRRKLPPEQIIRSSLERASGSGDFDVKWMGSVHAYLDELGDEAAIRNWLGHADVVRRDGVWSMGRAAWIEMTERLVERFEFALHLPDSDDTE